VTSPDSKIVMTNGCGAKHLKLLGLMVVIFLAIEGLFSGISWSQSSGHESRLNAQERQGAAIEQYMKSVDHRLGRIEEKLDK
jgi:hypothetical protein